MIEGVDYADARPSPAGLVAAGKKFVVRYGGPGRASKQVDAAELARLLGAGLSMVANAEGAAGGYRGTTAGRTWAAAAEAHFRTLGMPGDRPIYFSVDWNAGPGDWADIDAALRGSASLLGADRVGVYGGYATIAHCAAAGTARWFWQTYAWSGSPTRWHPACHLQQYHNGVSVAGGDCDLNRAMAEDFGQWGQETDVTPDQMVQVLTDFFGGPSLVQDPKTKEYDSGGGRSVWWHDVDGLRAWQVLSGTYKLAQAMATKLDVPLSQVLAAVGDVDEQVLADLADAGRSDQEVAAALRAALGDRAAAVGALLAGA